MLAKRDRFKEIFGKLFLSMGGIGLGTSIALYLFSPGLIRIIYGPNFFGSIPVLQTLALVMLPVFLGHLTTQSLVALDLNKLYLVVALLGAGLNIMLNYFLIPLRGAVGAAWATLATEIFVAALCGFFVLRREPDALRSSITAARETVSSNEKDHFMKGTKKDAINATFGHEKPTGLGVYTHELVLELLKAECDYDFTVYSSSPVLKKMYPEKVTRVSPLTSPALGFTGHLMRVLWQQTMLPVKLRRQNASLLYSTVPEGILFSPLKQIITMHDILPMKYPEMYPRMKYHFYYTLPLLLKKSQAVICTSENTKKDVTDYYAIKDKTVYVIYEGVNRQRFYPREKGVSKAYGLTKYLLYIGDMRPYKNLEKSLEAFARLNLTDHTFVIGGKKDPHFFPGIEKKVDRLFLKGKIIFLGYVPEGDLPHLFQAAAVSLYEGFGLPPLEAMACGCQSLHQMLLYPSLWRRLCGSL
jgi:glycosyltransferase involved in cell wall biosynthesis